MAVNVISARFVLPCGCALAHSITYSRGRHGTWKLQLRAAADALNDHFKAEAAKHVCSAATRGSRRA